MALKNCIVVTGAGRRIGYHMAIRLFQQGYVVLAHYRTQTAEIQALQDQGIATIQADFDSRDTILHFIEQLRQQCQSVRAMIHNASSFDATASDLTTAAVQYEQFFYVHMMAPFLINEGLRARMQGEGGAPADIIHITDIQAENPTPAVDIYGSTKAGLHNLTLAQAKKFAPDIKVNAIAPGPVLFAATHTDTVRKQILSETLLGKEGGAEAVYLAVQSILDNPFITGVSLPVDGGRRLTKN